MQQHTYKHIEAFSGKSWNKYKHRCNTRRQTHTDSHTKMKLQTFISRQQKKNWLQRCKKRFDYQGKVVFKLCRRDPKKSKAKGRNVCISMGFFSTIYRLGIWQRVLISGCQKGEVMRSRIPRVRTAPCAKRREPPAAGCVRWYERHPCFLFVKLFSCSAPLVLSLVWSLWAYGVSLCSCLVGVKKSSYLLVLCVSIRISVPFKSGYFALNASIYCFPCGKWSIVF